MHATPLTAFLNNHLAKSDLSRDLDIAADLAFDAIDAQGRDAENFDYFAAGYSDEYQISLEHLCSFADFGEFKGYEASNCKVYLKRQFASLVIDQCVAHVASAAGVDMKQAFVAFAYAYKFYRHLINNRLWALDVLLQAANYLEIYQDQSALEWYLSGSDYLAFKGLIAVAIEHCAKDQKRLLASF